MVGGGWHCGTLVKVVEAALDGRLLSCYYVVNAESRFPLLEWIRSRTTLKQNNYLNEPITRCIQIHLNKSFPSIRRRPYF